MKTCIVCMLKRNVRIFHHVPWSANAGPDAWLRVGFPPQNEAAHFQVSDEASWGAWFLRSADRLYSLPQLADDAAPNPNIRALLLRAGPGSTLAYLSEKTKPDWVVPPIRFLPPDKYLKYRTQNANIRLMPSWPRKAPDRWAQHF
jgi:hypothetical protein